MGKGGGGGGSVPQAKVPGGLQNLDNTVFPSLGYYGSSMLPALQSMANWASNIATGGNAMQSGSPIGYGNSNASFGQYGAGGSAATYNAFTQGSGSGGQVGGWQNPMSWNQVAQAVGLSAGDIAAFQRQGLSPDQVAQRYGVGGGFAQASAPGQGGQPGFQSAGSPTGMNDPLGMRFLGSGGSTTLSQAQVNQLTQAGYTGAGGQTLTAGMQITPDTQFIMPARPGQNQFGAGTSGSVVGASPQQSTTASDFFGSGIFGSQGGQGAGQTGGGQGGQGGQTAQTMLGPFLQNAWNAIGQEGQIASMIPGLMQQTGLLGNQALADSAKFMGQGDTMLRQGQSFLGQGNQLISTGQDLLSAGRGTYGQGQGTFNTGSQMLRDATTGAGLYPSQAAYVNQAVSSQDTALSSQLASMGLGNSTMLTQMKGQAAQAGAATAGQLIQGNISGAEAEQQIGLQQGQLGLGQQQIGLGQQQIGVSEQNVGLSQEQIAQNQYNLGQASQKLALGAQELSLGEQGALSQEMSTIAGQSSSLQGQMWNQAMQGYGTLGNMMSTALSAFGYAQQGYATQAQISEANAQIAAQAQQAAQQSNNQGFSSMLGGLGSILGSGSGGGGGLLGGLGGLFGGVGGTVAGVGGAVGGITALAGAGAGAAGGAGAGLAAIGTAAGLAFCEVPIQAGPTGTGFVAVVLATIAALMDRLERKRI